MNASAIWNRAANSAADQLTCRGDIELCRLLRAHGWIMNGGLWSAVEDWDADDVAVIRAAYRFFGLDDISNLITRAQQLLRGSPRTESVDQLEPILDAEYARIIPDDGMLFALFEKQLLANPEHYAAV